ncbi:hypothetical protein FQA39_LY05143 [Lamprigera yunnana]|nr:hypothetical protein FQA39_LY05143 [Lamprigera yunnana]
MTSSRVVRGSKGRILLGIFVIIAIIVIIACFNNSLTQLADARKNYEQCHQQQENLSTQLQVIFDYKQRLEKSLKTEKAEHQLSKKDFESKLEKEESHYKTSISEVNLKFSSLQQHYNLLQAEYDDFKEESSKIQRQQLSEANDLQAKVKELQGQLKQSMNEKDKAFEHLKSQYLQLQVEKENLEQEIKSTKEGDTKADYMFQKKADDVQKQPQSHNKDSEKMDVEIPNKSEDVKGDGIKNENDQLAPPKLEYRENFLGVNKSSTLSSNVISKATLDVQPLHVPNVTFSSLKSNPSPNSRVNPDLAILPIPYNNKRIPVGVLPVLDTHLGDEKIPKVDVDEKGLRDDANNEFPNRYRSNIILTDLTKDGKILEGDKKIDTVDKENNALEVFDPPANNIDTFGLDDTHVEVKRAQNIVPKQMAVNGVKAVGHKIYDGQENADYDKEVPHDMQQEEEAEDDDPEYNDHIARQKDPAVRN